MGYQYKKTATYDTVELLGLKTSLTQSLSKNGLIIANHWKLFNADVHKVCGYNYSKEHWVKYGVTYRKRGVLYYLAAIPNKVHYEHPENMETMSLTKGSYALFYHQGALGTIKDTLTSIFKEYLPFHHSEAATAGTNGTIYVEKYTGKFKWNSSQSIIELLVPVNT